MCWSRSRVGGGSAASAASGSTMYWRPPSSLHPSNPPHSRCPLSIARLPEFSVTFPREISASLPRLRVPRPSVDLRELREHVPDEALDGGTASSARRKQRDPFGARLGHGPELLGHACRRADQGHRIDQGVADEPVVRG